MELINELMASPEAMKEFQRERLAAEITEMIARLMKEQNVNRTELAARLGKSKAYVTKMLRHGSNLTVHTIADVFTALGRTFRGVERPLAVASPPLVVMEVLGQATMSTGFSFRSVGAAMGEMATTGAFTTQGPSYSFRMSHGVLATLPRVDTDSPAPRGHDLEAA